jgi:hypothetical protein
MRPSKPLSRAIFGACVLLHAAIAPRDVAAVEHRGVPDSGRGGRYWQQYSVIYAEILSTNHSPPQGFSIVIRPFGTLAGSFDAGVARELPVLVALAPTTVADDAVGEPTVRVPLDNAHFDVITVDGAKDREPTKGDKVILVLTRFWDRNWVYASGGPVNFMPGWWHQPLRIVSGFTDREVTEVMKAIRELRKDETSAESETNGGVPPPQSEPRVGYWSTHCLAFGRIRGTTQTAGGEPSLSIDFEPEVTLSGSFDCGKTVRVSLSADPGVFHALRKPTPIAAKSIVLLVRKEKSWAVASERPQFMPGDHMPICEVKDFDDPKVADTLKAIQEARKNEQDSTQSGSKRSNDDKR